MLGLSGIGGIPSSKERSFGLGVRLIHDGTGGFAL